MCVLLFVTIVVCYLCSYYIFDYIYQFKFLQIPVLIKSMIIFLLFHLYIFNKDFSLIESYSGNSAAVYSVICTHILNSDFICIHIFSQSYFNLALTNLFNVQYWMMQCYILTEYYSSNQTCLTIVV
jgi:hypothetical protein